MEMSPDWRMIRWHLPALLKMKRRFHAQEKKSPGLCETLFLLTFFKPAEFSNWYVKGSVQQVVKKNKTKKTQQILHMKISLLDMASLSLTLWPCGVSSVALGEFFKRLWLKFS